MLWNLLILLIFVLTEIYSPVSLGLFIHMLIVISLIWITRDIVRKVKIKKLLM